ncbi:MAG: protein-L-isoaspartate O-methyltransferase [Bacteroidetes bacterium GWC2_33_15]|nr:MAG: protein-L-isoaspartate O-methyltransferase [Bacteroidetes bacterium GWA2_33_15]OFX50062.1 MAG: protein-L-isoaspartate O-methyltransferase [Bacteroidetes bacterium GWC2_33_15]OFX65215.1 MAG: protein-L-isoaspartate O-methyltransferase [Bacteroidetes bacterium GWB2_32_14]OFX70441.1 MAG: protein-L-isoaspartate O-methyltransferase [Bacteroidetes bacterium GWD2_33_33]HAN19688.1 protein-L-isoaspartate O-methyltransferase [Bacteroidales bacterium]
MVDTYRHKGLRQKLVETIKEKGIKDTRILEAIGKVPRHLFMESGFVEFAYRDQAFPIGAGQTISQPYTVAFQTELLQVEKHQKVLEVGTGSGYQAAILMELGVKVYTIERQRELYLKSRTLLHKMGYKPYFFYGDGYLGQPSFAPFDKILITAGAPEIPRELLSQLKIGGRMVVPVGGSEGQVMMSVDRTGENDYVENEHGYFAFVPLLKGKQ